MKSMSLVRPALAPALAHAETAGSRNESAEHATLVHPRSLVRRLSVSLCALMLAACSTTKPWINQPIAKAATMPDVAAASAAVRLSEQETPRPVIAAVTLSGGGARAAAFGLGVLRELKATGFELDGRHTTLLDEVGLISGVSGGSVLAGYYAAFGDQVFEGFERDFLLVKFQSGLVHDIVSPPALYRLSSPWWGRSNELAQSLDRIYHGMTFGELRKGRPWPRLLVTATDLTTGAPFEFTPEQFALICSDFDSVHLSFAVAASSSVPLLLSPMTLRNYAGSCPQPASLRNARPADGNLSARMLHLIRESYRNAKERPYLHLVDGGLADNLGVRSVLDHTIASGSLMESFGTLPPGSVHRIVLVSVNSERDLGDRIDVSDRVPGTFQVLDALVFGAGSRLTAETTEIVKDTARRLADELASERGKEGSPFASDAEIYVINLRLRDLKDESMRKRLLQVPTAFEILPGQVHQLQAAGGRVLRESAEFQRLVRSLGAHVEAAASDSAEAPSSQ